MTSFFTVKGRETKIVMPIEIKKKNRAKNKWRDPTTAHLYVIVLGRIRPLIWMRTLALRNIDKE